MGVNVMRIQLQCRYTVRPLYLTRFVSHSSRPDDMVDRIIRVDHAGEYGADRIYAGQLAVLQNTSIGPTIKVQWAATVQLLIV